MRAKVFVVGGALAGVVLVGEQGVAFAAEKPTEVSKCVENAVKTGQQADSCLKAPNPIVPSANELIWGAISFVALFYLLWKYAFPAVRKGMDGRAERIRESLDEAVDDLGQVARPARAHHERHQVRGGRRRPAAEEVLDDRLALLRRQGRVGERGAQLVGALEGAREPEQLVLDLAEGALGPGDLEEGVGVRLGSRGRARVRHAARPPR